MISAVLTTLTLLSPQQQPPQPAAPAGETSQPKPGGKTAPATKAAAKKTEAPKDLGIGMTANAGLFPEDTLALISLAPFVHHEKSILETGFARLFESSLISLSRSKVLPHLEELGFPKWDSTTLLRHGASFGITGLASQQRAHWLLAANLGGRGEEFAALIRKHHEVLKTRGARVRGARTELVDRSKAKPAKKGDEKPATASVWTITHADRRMVTWVIHEDVLLVGDTQAGVTTALRQRYSPDPARSSMLTSEAYRRFASRSKREGNAFLQAFVQPQPVIQSILAKMPEELRTRFDRFAKHLDLLNVSEIGYSLFAKSGEIRDLAWLGYPRPIQGLLRALASGKDGVKISQHQTVTPDAVSVSFTSVHWTEIYKHALSLVRTIDPSIPQLLTRQLETIKSDARVDLIQDVLAHLGDQVAMQEWHTKSGSLGSWGLTIDVRDGGAVQDALDKLGTYFGLARTTIGGRPAVSIPNNRLPTAALPGSSTDGAAVVLVHENKIVAANSTVAAQKILKALSQRPGHPRVRAALGTLTQKPVAFSWSDCARYGEQVLQTLSLQWGHGDTAKSLARILSAANGAMVTSVHTSTSGIAFRSKSPFGNLFLSLSAAYFLDAEVRRHSGTTTLSPEELIARKQSNHLAEIAAAQRAFHDSLGLDADKDGTGEYTTLDVLAAKGFLDTNAFQATKTPGLFRADGYLFRTWLPKGTNGREASVLTLAWPADRATGIVFATDEKGRIHKNSILAHLEGLPNCEPRDFYVRGVFGAPIKSGWKSHRRVGTAVAKTDTSDKTLSEEQKKAFDQIELAESTGTAPAEVILFLESDNPMIAARAAYAMGKVKCEEAIPALSRMVHEHESQLVQQQAMGALLRIGKPRSVNTAVKALSSIDGTVRALAAQHIGALRVKDAKDKLLEVLSISSDTDAPDRIAALVALADIGDPEALIPAATSAKTPGPKEEEALVYLFQTLSHKLDQLNETQTLITALSSHSEMLRRFAIQRLGVLKATNAVKALEGRLAVETTLQDLVKVSLDSIRGSTSSEESGSLAGLQQKAEQLWVKAKTRWNNASSTVQYAILGGAGLFVVLIVVWRIGARRRRRIREGEAMVAMIGHSDEFEEQQSDDWDDDEAYGDESGAPSYYGEQEQTDYDNIAPAMSNVDMDDGEDFVQLDHDAEYDDWDEVETEDVERAER